MRRLAASLAVLLALTASACGGGGEETSSTPTGQAEQSGGQAQAKLPGGEAQRERQQPEGGAATSEDEREARQTTAEFYAILGQEGASGDPDRTTIDSASFCELMSAQARQQTVHYAEVSSGIAREWDCESAVEMLAIRSKDAGGFKEARRAEVIGVNAEGERATATVRFGPTGAATSIPLVREDGEWKLASSPESGR